MGSEQLAREEGKAERRPTAGAYLSVLHTGDKLLRDRSLPIGDGLCIGRVGDSGVDLAIDDRLLSRRHATIKPLGHSPLYELVDHDSRNGSYLDGVRLSRSHASEGAIIRLGVCLFVLTSEPSEVGTELPAGFGKNRDAFIGHSGAFRRLCAQLDEAAAKRAPVVLTGEPGSGKGMAASYLHEARSCKGPLVMVGCGGSRLRPIDLLGGVDPDRPSEAPIEGFLAMAEGGTLLFDEVDLLDPTLQPLLLEIMRTESYRPLGSDEPVALDAFVVAATGVNVDAAVDAGVLSGELADAFSVAIELPSLSDRRTDIPLLGQHFLQLEEPRRRLDWSVTFLEKLLLYDWPHNVRELRTVMRRSTMVEEEVTTLRSAHLPKKIRRRVRMPTEDALRASSITIHAVPSRAELQELLSRHSGDVERIADHYGKDRRHVYRWLSRHDVSVGDYRK